ncbi:hypothetical protein B6N25_06305 [Sphingobacteriales bacterium TSM_CSS]|nr:hypothetical protein B6N25_06305 [Sphingobacteriales bacterium TSM_CSS]
MALQYENKIQALCPLAVLIMGEFTFSFTLVALLQQRNITCIAATCHRNTIDHPDGTKTTIFRFEQFRVYPPVANSVIPESSNLTRFHKIPNLET